MVHYKVGSVTNTEDPFIFEVEVIVYKKVGQPPVEEEITRFNLPYNITQSELVFRYMAEAGFKSYKALQDRIKAAEDLAKEQLEMELPPPVP